MPMPFLWIRHGIMTLLKNFTMTLIWYRLLIDKLLAKHLKHFPEVDVSDVQEVQKKDPVLKKIVQLNTGGSKEVLMEYF